MAPSLFERYGGFASVSRIVMSFYDRILDDERVGGYFDDVDMRSLIDHQTKFVASLMGGPASYTDDALRQVHAHLDVDAEAFDAMTSLLEGTLVDAGIDPAHVDELITEFTRRKPLIVTG